MPIHGVDVSRYQGLESLDGQSFVIVNVEDPGLADKIAHAKQLGIPWGLYTWVYPGSGRADMARAAAQVSALGDPPLGFWLDYEQAGVTPNDLTDALDHAHEILRVAARDEKRHGEKSPAADEVRGRVHQLGEALEHERHHSR